MYSKFAGIVKGTGGDMQQVNLKSKKVLLKQHHHVNLDREFKADCKVWVQFLQSETNATCRPFIDMTRELTVDVLNFYTDTAKGLQLGFGCVFGSRWMYGQWGANFIKEKDPSIGYLELYGLSIAILARAKYLQNKRVEKGGGVLR